jgi:hypothetical protein
MYQVIWTTSARLELAAIWNSAQPADDQLLIWAVADIAFRLARDPNNEGESRPQDTRVMFSWPLGVLFDVPDDKTVWVHSIWRHA